MRRPPLLLCLVALVPLVACSDDGETSPLTLEASLAEHPISAVSAVLDVATNDDAEVTVEVRGQHASFPVPVGDDRSEVPVVGMRAEQSYQVVITASNDRGEVTQELDWTTGALPDDLPPITLEAADAERAQPGVTVFNVMSFAEVPEGGELPDGGYIVAVDGEGHVVWYHRMPLQLLDVDATSRGTFLVTAGETAIHEIDLLGRTVREWAGRIATDGRGTDLNGRPLVGDDPQSVEIDSAHHEVLELPNGNVLTLSTELFQIDQADAERLCPESPGTNLIGDVVVELDPEGEVVHEWAMSDVFDPVERPGTELCREQLAIAPPMWFYPEADDPRDWTHANAIALDEEANALLVSLRHLDAVVAIRYQDDEEGDAGELLWELGPHGTLELTGEHLAHQHAHELLGDDELLVYDNGNDKGPPPYSRAVIYRLDAEAGTAEQVWEHRDTTPEGTPMFTPFLGDADRLADGNILITHGGASGVPGDFSTLYGRVVEVDRETDEIVWDLVVGDRTTSGWTLYRSERHPSLYELAPQG